jgi:chemosensory pili system protein ChpA (sensor histidine kinase/response regulator)
MAERRNYIALDWVTGEIEETLKQARQSLEDYVEEREDFTKLRFCLTYAHQVHGSLKMVELHGAALLAAEIEALAQSLVVQEVEDVDSALEVLMAGLLQLSAYLQRVQTTHEDQPSTLLPTLNELREIRGEEELTGAAVFNPDIDESKHQVARPQKPAIQRDEFNDLIRKLRQAYQSAMVGIVRDQNVEINFDHLLKVGARLHKVSEGTASEPLWTIIHAALQALVIDAQPASPEVKTVLRHIDGELKALQEHGRDALEAIPPASLLKSLLYTVAQSAADTDLIVQVQKQYKLKLALENSRREAGVPLPDTAAIRSVVDALNEELDGIQDILDQNARMDIHPGYELAEALPVFQRVINTLSVLGATDALNLMRAQKVTLEQMLPPAEVDADRLMDVAAHIVAIQDALNRSRSLDEARNLNVSNDQLDQAHLSVIREARNGLEQAKEAVIEFVASQWNVESLYDVPPLLEQIGGGLSMIPLPRAAGVIDACRQYVDIELLEKGIVPEWQMLDTLADAMTSVEYYLECLSGDSRSEIGSILDVACESVAKLGYSVAGESASFEAPQSAQDIPTVTDEVKPETLSPAYHLEDIDDEVVEIFIEEAAEVLETINTYLPKWEENLANAEAVVEIRRAYHTLKGSGRMVGAEIIGEFSWAIEGLLNRLVEGNRSANFEHLDVVKLATAIVPGLVDAFQQGRDYDDMDSVQAIATKADLLASRTMGAVLPAQSVKDSLVIQDPDLESQLDIDVPLERNDSEEQDLAHIAADERASDTGMVFDEVAVSLDTAEPEPEPEPELSLADDSMSDIDEDVIEIFIEEVGEVLETIEEYMPRWQSNLQDSEALGEIRRSFHTLKGSGRMVEAQLLADLAWAIESMLNRVLEGNQQVGAAHVDMVNRSRALIPALVDAYEKRVVASEKTLVMQLVELAERIAKGDDQFDVAEALSGGVSSDTGLVADNNNTVASVQEPSGDEASVAHEGQDLDISDDADDSTLLEIFTAEAIAHMRVYDAFVSSAVASGGHVELSEDLQRALHTLKGSAYMAEVNPIADVVTPIEKLVKEMRGCHLFADENIVALLAEGAQLIHQGMAQLLSHPDQRIAGLDDYLAHLHVAHQSQLALLSDDIGESTDAAQQASALLVNGMEKLLHASDLVSNWGDNELSAAQLVSLIDDLDSLASVADQAEYPPVSELSFALADLYRQVTAGARHPEQFISTIQNAHEALIDMMDVIAAGQSPASVQNVIESLQSMADQIVELEQKDLSESVVLPELDLATDAAAIRSLLPGLDTETLEIFMEEAGELVEVLDDGLSRWIRKPEEQGVGEELKRHLHTLKGGARLTGISLLGDVSHDYETFLETYTADQDGFFDGLRRYQERVRIIVDAIMSGPDAESDVESSPAPAEESPAYADELSLQIAEDVDPEMIEILMEEAREQQEAIENVLHNWRDGQESGLLEELKRILHTLKGGARLAGVASLGNLAHNFETYLINSELQGDLDSAEFASRVGQYQDQLAVMLDTLAKFDTTVNEIDAPVNAVDDVPMLDDVVAQGSVSQVNLPALPDTAVSAAAVQAAKNFVDAFEKEKAQKRGPEEVIKVSASLLQNLVNLAGETSISRARVEEQMSELSFSIEEMEMTIDRLKGQLRRLEIETEAQIMFRMEQVESEGAEGFDPLEMDRYSHLQQLARSLIESASDIQDVKETFSDTVRDMETLLLQQSRINTELQEGLMRSQMVPFSRMVPRLRRIVRQVASELGKNVDFHFDNVEGELDRTVLERMVAPLEHMLRNAVDHGIESIADRRKAGKSETGNISLSVGREGAEVVITLSDDGGGVNTDAVRKKAIERGLIDAATDINEHDITQFILHAGFSTATEVTQISGRGVGMDVVHSEIKQLGGSMEIDSVRGQGSEFSVRLPFTVSVNRALMVCIGNDTYAIPLNSIEGIVRVSPYELEAYYQPDAPLFEYAGQSYSLMYMGGLLDMGAKPRLEGQTMPLPVVLVRGGEHSVAVQVDRLLGSREIVVKSLGPQFSMVEGLSGATVLGDGSVVVIMDLMAMIRSQTQAQAQAFLDSEHHYDDYEEQRNLRVMVVDDSVTVRKVTSRFLERHGIDVSVAKDGIDAMQKLLESDFVPDVMLLDIEMPRMDGFEVASRVRHTERLKDIPIIMITSRTGEKHRERALSLGVNHYLGKPYQESLLLDAISSLTGKVVEQ